MTTEMTLLADVAATEIPAGNQELLPAGTRLHVMQTLGGNVTVRTHRGLFRIAGADAAAIQGFDVGTISTAPAEAAAEFSEALAWEALKTCFDPGDPRQHRGSRPGL